MGLQHYFSRDEDKRAKFVFNLIAPVYGLIDKAIGKEYKKVAKIINAEIPLQNKSILDVGTGTGSWLVALHSHRPSRAIGIDFSEKMLRQAKQNHPQLGFQLTDGENLNCFSDSSFDIVTASFVLHGMKKDKRILLLKEMKRVSKKYVIIHDFYGKTHFIIKILEFFERSDYINFKKNFRKELESIFEETRIIGLKSGNAVFVGENGNASTSSA
ncbi:MAG: class I SAM-dependent methyltransferase [Chlorobi bacterium]|nr:class I SAM-dependent methyltransferase [Chlorobiota bacterium]